MSRRVLIIVSSYDPVIIADMHRARHLAWTMPNHGWEVEILTPGNEYQQPFCIEPAGEVFFSEETPVHRVALKLKNFFEVLKMGNIGWRALYPLLVKGRELLRTRRFDLVYISTTQFPLFLLGPIWEKDFGVPYILDFHDPCYREKSTAPVWTKKNIKHRVSVYLARWIERVTVQHAAGIIAVSPAYIEVLIKRYRSGNPFWLAAPCHKVIPFGFFAGDFEIAEQQFSSNVKRNNTYQSLFRIVYVGAGGPIMCRSFRVLCRTLSKLVSHAPGSLTGIVIELSGTHFGWCEGDPRYLADVAAQEGVADYVREDPRRVTYRESLERLLDAAGVLILGVEDDGYMPSKLFSYAASGKPMLAVLRRKSPAFALFEKNSDLGHALWFDEDDTMPEEEAEEVAADYLAAIRERRVYDRSKFLKPYTADEMARQHAELFELCLRQR